MRYTILLLRIRSFGNFYRSNGGFIAFQGDTGHLIKEFYLYYFQFLPKIETFDL